MKWFLNLRTGAKLFLGFGLMIVFLAIVIVTAYRSIAAIQTSQRALFEQDFTTATDLLTLEIDENAVRASVLEMMSLTNQAEREVHLLQIKEHSTEIDEISRRLFERYRNDPTSLLKLEEWKTVREAYKQTRETQTVPLILEGKTDAAKAIILGIQQDRYTKMRAITLGLGNEAVAKAQNALKQSEQRASESVYIFLIIGAIALMTGVVMAVLLNRIISRPLQEIAGVANRMASGDLTVNVSLDHRRDEVGELAQTFRRMTENLRGQIRSISEGVNVLGSSANEISTSTSQLAAGASQTATAVTETTTTVEEVKQTAQVSSQKAKSVSESAQKAAQISQNGKKATEEASEGMNRIRQQMESIAESMVRLSEQTQAIGQIIATVDDLAAQSNLLAVNASIEAAKAGEQGKGFAVVAQEVKSLAEQSKQATTQVRTILSDIQKATSAAAMATEQGTKAVELGGKQSVQAGESIQTLSASVSEAAQAATQIAASSQQQLVGVDQVASAMESIKQASTQNVDSAKQLEVAAHNLNGLGQKLKQLVEQYKV